MRRAGISGFFVLSANSHAASTTKAGLMNSEGWMVMLAMVSQRRAPFTSGPTTKVASSSTRKTRNTPTHTRRSARGVRKEVRIITTAAGRRKSTCRFTKWKGSEMFSRAATAGLAARHKMMPMTIKAARAASKARSTVHHHSLRAVRSARDIMGWQLRYATDPAPCPRQV